MSEIGVKAIDQRIAELSPDQLALLFERLGRTAPQRAAAVSAGRSDRASDARPLSFGQERLWFLEQLSPGGSDYNVVSALRLRGAVALDALEQALQEVVRRHEVLRTSFPTVDGGPVQRVEGELRCRPVRVGLAGLRRSDRERESDRLAQRVALRPFDLARAPLLRICWIDLDEHDHLLVLALHHIVCDAWSLQILNRELVELYRAFVTGQPSPLPELAIQYADHAERQRAELSGERLERLLEHWRQQLQGAPAEIEIPGALPESGAGTPRGAEVIFSLGVRTTDALKALGRAERVTSFMMLTALFGALLHVESGQEDLCLGANAAQRGDLASEELVGVFVNQVVLRLRPRGTLSFRELARHVRAVTEEAHAHQELPFERLVEALCPERSSGRNALFQAKVELQSAESGLELPGLELSAIDIAQAPLRCDLLLIGWSSGEGLTCSLIYDAGRFREDRVKQMAAGLVRIGEIVAEEPDISLRDLAERLARASREQRAAERERLNAIDATKLKLTRRKGVLIRQEEGFDGGS